VQGQAGGQPPQACPHGVEQPGSKLYAGRVQGALGWGWAQRVVGGRSMGEVWL